MNICLLTSSYLPKVGGLEIVVHSLATALANMGHNVVVVAPSGRICKPDTSYNYSVVRFGFRGSTRLRLTPLVAVSTLIRVARKFAIDVINVHDVHAPGTWVRYFHRLQNKIPVVGTPHGDDIQLTPEIQDGVRLNPKIDKVVRRNVNTFTKLTAISPSIRADLTRIVRTEAKIVDVPNGVWVSDFFKDIDKVKVRDKYGIPLDSTILISVGRNHPRKGFVDAIDAVAKLRKAGTNVLYLLVGRDMSPIVRRAAGLGISDCLVTPGEVTSEKVSEFLRASDIYVSPSIVESFGLATLEAMSAGLSCVVTDVPGSRDLVSSDYGLLVPPSSVDALAEAISYLVENPILRKSLGTKAHIAAQQFDWHRIAACYVDVYTEAISSLSTQT